MGQVYDKDYFFIRPISDDRVPSLAPDEDTVELPYSDTALPVGRKPLIFHNGAFDWQKEQGLSPLDPPPEILFSGSNVLVSDKIREKLLSLEIPGLAIQPSIYIDHKDQWHESYWFLTFTSRLDCWNRAASKYVKRPIGQEKKFHVLAYSLDDELLESIPLDQRTLFKMGGTATGMIVAHYSVAPSFQSSGADLIPVNEFGSSSR